MLMTSLFPFHFLWYSGALNIRHTRPLFIYAYVFDLPRGAEKLNRNQINNSGIYPSYETDSCSKTLIYFIQASWKFKLFPLDLMKMFSLTRWIFLNGFAAREKEDEEKDFLKRQTQTCSWFQNSTLCSSRKSNSTFRKTSSIRHAAQFLMILVFISGGGFGRANDIIFNHH